MGFAKASSAGAKGPFSGWTGRASIAGMITFEAIEVFDGKESVGWKVLLDDGEGETRVVRRA
jgi:hypothetical protein